MDFNYKKLQNGSDIRGIAVEGVENEPVNLDKTTVERLGKAFLYLLSIKTGKNVDDLSIAIGYDSRISGPDIFAWLKETLMCHGVTVLQCHMASTPAMFMATQFDDVKADGSIMITASHLPYNRNGFKFFTKKGGFEKADITDIINFAESNSVLSKLPRKEGNCKDCSLIEKYSDYLKTFILSSTGEEAKPLKGMRICVDAGNGAGGFYAEKVLQPLGADISSSQFLDPDGTFPNHVPNPENKDAMKSICDKVKSSKADFGLIFDTDVDRVSAVDESGNEINRDKIIALAAALIASEHPGTTVVTDSVTSNHLTDFLCNQLKLNHMRYKRGYRNVIGKSQELCNLGVDSQLAIETSGHAAYKENFFLDDGAYLATKIVIAAAKLSKQGKTISSLIENLSMPLENTEIRVPITTENFKLTGETIISQLKSLFQNDAISNSVTSKQNTTISIVQPNYEGIRIEFKGEVNGWFLLRQSLHDPIIPINLESDNEGGVKFIMKWLKPHLQEFEKELDLNCTDEIL